MIDVSSKGGRADGRAGSGGAKRWSRWLTSKQEEKERNQVWTRVLCEVRKCKGQVVLRCDMLKDDSGDFAVLNEQVAK